MEVFAKKTYLILYIYSVNILQSQGNQKNSATNSTHSGRLLNKIDEWKLQYQMLIDFERRRFRFIQNFEENGEIYSDLFVIRSHDVAEVKSIGGRCGFTFIRKVFDDENYYLFRRFTRSRKRCRRDSRSFLPLQFDWASRQVLKHRVKRNLVNQNYFLENEVYQKPLSYKDEKLFWRKISTSFRERNIDFNDPFFPEQWYLLNLGQTGSPAENDINVLPVWQSGITGRGVSISVLDDGIYSQSPEVSDNYDFVSSEEFLYQNSNHSPIPENSHGTYCAAIAAGVANNRICGVGVAYEAKVGGVRILDGPLTDVQEALALVHALDHVDIYTASWGPPDDGRSVDGPGILTRMAFVKGVTMVVPEGKGKCRETFQGTSAAAPMAAGVIALAIQANPNLTWRDVQHIIIRSSKVPATNEVGWLINGAGFTFHPKIGSGVLDADTLVKLAKKWLQVRPLRTWTKLALDEKRLLLPNQETVLSTTVLKSSMPVLSRINYLEAVIVTINLFHPRCGDLEVIIESPASTRTSILTRRPHDNITTRFKFWDFMTLHLWGEDPEGSWTLRVLNANEKFTGYVDYISIRLHGTDY